MPARNARPTARCSTVDAPSAASESTMSTAAAISAKTISVCEDGVVVDLRRRDERRARRTARAPRRVLDAEVAVGHVAARDPLAVGAIDGGVGDPGAALEARDEQADGEGRDRGDQREERASRLVTTAPAAPPSSSPRASAPEPARGQAPARRRGSSSASRTKGRNHGM